MTPRQPAESFEVRVFAAKHSHGTPIVCYTYTLPKRILFSMCPIQIAQGRLLLRQNFRLAIPESFRGQMERLSSHCSLTVLFAWTNNPTNGCCSTTGTFRQFRRSNWNFVVVVAVCCCFVWRNLDRVQNYFESTDAVAILNDEIRNEKKNCDCLWTTFTGKHWKWRGKF